MNQTCSVVIPTHNRRDRMLRTLLTVRAQDYPDLEIIVSDDGSSDDTADVVASINDPRVKVVRSEQAQGVATARNRAIDVATGRWIAVCDDDDFWSAGKISGQVAAMKDNGSRWSYCYAAVVSDNLRFLYHNGAAPTEDFRTRLLIGNRIPGGCSTVVVEKALLDEVGYFDPRFSMFADWDLWIRCAEVDTPAVWPDYGTLYVHHAEQMSMDMSKINNELGLIRSKHTAQREAQPAPRFEPVDGWVTQRLWRTGNYRSALSHAWNSPGSLSFPMACLAAIAPYRSRLRSRLNTNTSEAAQEAIAAVKRTLATGVSAAEATSGG